MKIMGFGLNRTGGLLFSPIDVRDALQSLRVSLERNAPGLQRQSVLNERGRSFRGEVARRVKDAGDPREAGWTFMVAENDPRRAEVIDIIRPLAIHRGMEDPSTPLVFDEKSEDCWGEWLQNNYWARVNEAKKAPKYVLMVGAPAHLPFKFQSLMDTVANVGRVEFDTPAELDTYVKKLIRLETEANPVVKREVVVFGVDEGPADPTYYSRQHMAEPLAANIKKEFGFNVTSLMAADATKSKLEAALRDSQPAMVYTASHGLGLIGRPLVEQKLFNGAICCQTGGQLAEDDIFSAEDVPTDRPFLEGAVFFQFACY